MDNYILNACLQAASGVAGGFAASSNATPEQTLEVFWSALGHAKAFAEENGKPPKPTPRV